MEVKKILSVDFDIVMHTCIKLYNRFSAGDQNPTQLWNYIEHEIDCDKFLNCDMKIVEAILIKMISIIQKNNVRFLPITEHQMIVDDLKSIGMFDTDCIFDIVNIDFHHDLGYGDSSKINTKYFNEYSCADWLRFLIEQKKINSIVWVGATNSEPFNSDETLENTPIDFINISQLNRVIDEDNYDYIYFCASPQWVPYKYKSLYELMCNVLNQIQELKKND